MLLACSGLLAACSNDMATETATELNDAEKNQALGTYLTVSTDLSVDQSASTRVGYERTTKDGKPYLNFVWEEGDKVKVYTYFNDGVNGKAAQPVEATIGAKNSAGNYTLTYKVAVPAGIKFDKNTQIIGALGVDTLTDDGKASISWDDTEISTNAAGKDFKLPMYFHPIKATKTSSGDYYIRPHFKMYGSIIELKLTSEMYDPFEPRQFILETKAFTSEGTMNLYNTTATTAPSWTPTVLPTNAVKSYYITKSGVVVGRRTAEGVTGDVVEGTYFLWVMPTEGAGVQPMTVTVQDYAYIKTGPTRSEPLKKTWNIPQLVQGKFYDLTFPITSDLIITEVYSSTTGNAYEFYNPTTKDINLGEYFYVTEDYETLEKKAVKLGSTVNIYNPSLPQSLGDVWLRWAHPDAKKDANGNYILPPGKTIVYWPSGLALSNLDVNNIESKKKSAWIIMHYSSATSSINQGDPYNTALTFVRNPRHFPGSIRKTTIDDSNIVDVFFRTDPPSSPGIGVATYIRRPDRNFPRKYMSVTEKDENSDWVYVSLTTADLGYRYGPYDKVANGKVETNIDNLVYPNYYIHIAGYRAVYLRGGTSAAVSTDLYFPPYYWNYYWSH